MKITCQYRGKEWTDKKNRVSTLAIDNLVRLTSDLPEKSLCLQKNGSALLSAPALTTSLKSHLPLRNIQNDI